MQDKMVFISHIIAYVISLVRNYRINENISLCFLINWERRFNSQSRGISKQEATKMGMNTEKRNLPSDYITEL